jgi:hypothetical protein
MEEEEKRRGRKMRRRKSVQELKASYKTNSCNKMEYN